MSSTAFKDAFRKVGVLPFKEIKPPIEIPDVRALSDIGLIERIDQERIKVADITRQLDDDKAEGMERGEDWRFRARKSRRLTQVLIDNLETEAKRRGLIAALPIMEAQAIAKREIARERQEQEARAREEKAIRHEEVLRKQEEYFERKKSIQERYLARERSRAELFVAAARQLHSKDACARIWHRAMRMFPGHDAWKDFKID